MNPLRGVGEVNEAVCKGCGSCAAHCPSGAAKVRHFTDSQIFAEIDGLLAGSPPGNGLPSTIGTGPSSRSPNVVNIRGGRE